MISSVEQKLKTKPNILVYDVTNGALYVDCLSVTPLRPMQVPIKQHTIKSGWYIVYIEGSLIISKPLLFFIVTVMGFPVLTGIHV